MTLAAAGRAVEPLLRGGNEALWIDGNLSSSRDWFDAAYRMAERESDADAMALAAIGLGGLWVHEYRKPALAILMESRQRRAMAVVDAGSTLALRIRARLAGETDYRSGGHAAILAIVEEARRSGDPVAFAETANLAHHCVLGPGHGALRRRLADELIAASFQTERPSDLLMGMLWRTVDLFLDADPHAERSLEELRGLLGEQKHLAVDYVVRSIKVMLALRAGRFAAAELAAADAAERGRAAGDADATGWYGGSSCRSAGFRGGSQSSCRCFVISRFPRPSARPTIRTSVLSRSRPPQRVSIARPRERWPGLPGPISPVLHDQAVGWWRCTAWSRRRTSSVIKQSRHWRMTFLNHIVRCR